MNDRTSGNFELVTIHRPMVLFGRALHLTPEVPAVPDSLFLLCLVTGHESGEAALRHYLGEKNFKNLENLIRQTHKTTDGILDRLAELLDVDRDLLLGLVHGRREGPLLPQLIDLFVGLEAIANRMFASLTSKAVSCPCCGGDIMADSEAWWDRQLIRLGTNERRFIDRLLGSLVGLSFFNMVVDSDGPGPDFTGFSKPPKHPMGNWVEWLVKTSGCKSVRAFCEQFPIEFEKGAISERQVGRYRRGEVLIPFIPAEEIIQAMPDPGKARLLLIVARTLSLACEFVAAASKESIEFGAAQALVHSRFEQLHWKRQVAIYAAHGIGLRRAQPDGTVTV
jgi:hypothetical protein